jgi:hypothetical protein
VIRETGTREEPCTLTQGGALFSLDPGSSRLGIEPKTPGWRVFITARPSAKLFTWGGGGYGRTCATRDDEPLVQDPTTSPSGDLIPTIRGSGAHPGRGW